MRRIVGLLILFLIGPRAPPAERRKPVLCRKRNAGIVQQSVGWTKDEPLVMYNPPWTLTFILPFCAGDYFFAKFMWLMILLVILFICNHMLWTYYNGCEENRVLSLIAFGSFAPVYFMISKGQIVPLILVGLVGFLHYNQKSKWWLAALLRSF